MTLTENKRALFATRASAAWGLQGATALALLCFLAFLPTAICHAQEQPTVEWTLTLRALESRARSSNMTDEERARLQDDINRLERRIEAWLKAHPEIKFEEASMSTASGNDQSTRDLSGRVSRLKAVVEEIIRRDPNSPFSLGRIEVTVSAELSDVATAGLTDVVEQADMQRYNRKTVADTLNLLPGVMLTRIGPRNEKAVFVRGFDVDQTPVFIDGIPVYVPYDGYLDLDRFTTFDLSEVRVSKGFSSPLYGANTIGGAINLISRRPVKKIEGTVGMGASSGDSYDAFLNLGARFNKFYVQAGGSNLQSQRFPLSGNFRPTRFQPDADDRLNAQRRDAKGNIRLGYIPNERSEYSFTYVNQRGRKGNPPYAGDDIRITRPRYWRWDYWNKESFYYISNSEIGSGSYVRLRGFYDKFDNLLRSYDDATFMTQTRPFAFNSFYDDDTFGGSVEFGTRRLERQQVKAALHFKRDQHRENNAGEPVRTFKDQIASFGLEDTMNLTGRLFITAGLSVDHLDIMRAQDFQQGVISEFPIDGKGTTAVNPQVGVFYTLTENGRLRATFSRKSRLPTIKDRYSYRMGQAFPNPDLRAERSNNYEIGYSHAFSPLGMSTFVEASVFYSDISDLIQRFVLSPTLFQLRNVASAAHSGAEFSVRNAFTSRVDGALSYTYLNRENKSDPLTILTETPRHKLFASLAYSPIRRLRLQGVLQTEAGRYNLNEAGAVRRLDQFTIVDAQASYQIKENIEAQIGASNIFDRNYSLFEGYPEAGRTLFVNVRYRF
jgi:iron complex outermembrane recepter protein